MNYGAHLETALKLRPEASNSLLFGSMAPDFASMAGTKLDHERLPQKMARGVNLHIAADTAFHNLEEFLTLRGEAQAELAAVFPTHPARAYAEMGTEILLDGVLFEDNHGIATNYDSVMRWAIDPENIENLAVLARNARAFRAVLIDRAEMGPPPAYTSPEAVARIVHRHLTNHRPRLSFDEAHLPFLAEVYARQQERLKKCGNSLIESTIAALA